MNEYCVHDLLRCKKTLNQTESMEKCFEEFTKLLSTALQQSPLKEFFPESGDASGLVNAIWRYFLQDFLQFAEASSAPDGGRFAFFDSATSAKKLLTDEKLAIIRKRLNANPKDSSVDSTDAKEKLSELIGAFMGNLKKCLLSDQVEFQLGQNGHKKTFRGHFASAVEAWLNVYSGVRKATNGNELSMLRENYDNALKAFQAPLPESQS
jgi:hypothetical protein